MSFAAVAAIASVVSAGASIKQGMDNKKAQKQQLAAARDANEITRQAEAKRQQIADLQAARQRRQAVREAQERRAQVVAGAEQAGASGSSGLSGATGSIQTQASENLSFLDQTAMLSSQAASLFGEARAIQNTPIFADTTGQMVAGLAGSVGTFAKGREGTKLSDLFS